MRQRKTPEDFQLRWRCAKEVKESLRPYGGPASVGSADTIPPSTLYKAQAGDPSSFLYRFCLALLCCYNAGADTAVERLVDFVNRFRDDLERCASDDELERLIEREFREDDEADHATYVAALSGLQEPISLIRLAKERRDQGAVALAVARAAEVRARRLRQSCTF